MSSVFYQFYYLMGVKVWVCLMCEPASHASHASHSANHASQASQDASHDFNARKCF